MAENVVPEILSKSRKNIYPGIDGKLLQIGTESIVNSSYSLIGCLVSLVLLVPTRIVLMILFYLAEKAKKNLIFNEKL